MPIPAKAMKSTVPAIREVSMVILMTLPWLNPFAPGPSPAVVPWLVALAAVAGLLLLASFSFMKGVATHDEALAAQSWVVAIAWAWALAGLLSSAIGLLQYFGAASAFSPWISQTPLGEAFANLRQRNQFASLTNIALAAVLWLEASNRLKGDRGLLASGLACLLAMGNAASSSRTGLLQLTALCVLVGLWGGWRSAPVRRVLLTAAVAYALATLALPWLASFDLSDHGMFSRLRAGDAVCASRLTLWSNVLQLVAQKPWWGWGELDYAHYMTQYEGPRFCEILDNAHNLPLHLAVEFGIPVALLVCGGLGWWVWRQRPWRETGADRQLAWTVLTMILLHSLLEYPLWYGPFQMAVGFCLVLLWPTRRIPIRQGIHQQPSLALMACVLGAIVFIAGCAAAAWDYYRISQIYLPPQDRRPAYRDNTLAKIGSTWFFDRQVRFAELSTTPLTRANAQWTFDTATALLHYSPEPRVIEKAIESAVLLHRDSEALMYLARYRAAFPADHARWAQVNTQAPARLSP